MWWIPPSVAYAALWGPTSTLLTWAHLRNSLGNEAVSSGRAHKEKLHTKAAVASPISTIFLTFHLPLPRRTRHADVIRSRPSDSSRSLCSLEDVKWRFAGSWRYWATLFEHVPENSIEERVITTICCAQIELL